MYFVVPDGIIYLLILFEGYNWKVDDYANESQISVCVVQWGDLQEDSQFLSSTLASTGVLKSSANPFWK